MSNGVLGMWTLRSYVMEAVETGHRSEPFGHEPRGALVLHDDGRMVALVTAQPGGDPGVGAERGPAAGKLIAYSGRYRLEAPDRLVTTVDVASFENWIGTEQVRTCRLDGGTLELSTPPGRMPQPGGGEVTVRSILSWVRDLPASAGEHR